MECKCGGNIRCCGPMDEDNEGRPWECDTCGRDVS